MHKLVRDRLPEIISQNGRGETPHYRKIRDDKEFLEELLKKLTEEAREATGAVTHEERLLECADVVEVILALLALQGTTRRQFMRILRLRREERGGYEGRIFLEGVDAPTPREPLFAK